MIVLTWTDYRLPFPCYFFMFLYFLAMAQSFHVGLITNVLGIILMVSSFKHIAWTFLLVAILGYFRNHFEVCSPIFWELLIFSQHFVQLFLCYCQSLLYKSSQLALLCRGHFGKFIALFWICFSLFLENGFFSYEILCT